jgi:hypothetical protein
VGGEILEIAVVRKDVEATVAYQKVHHTLTGFVNGKGILVNDGPFTSGILKGATHCNTVQG